MPQYGIQAMGMLSVHNHSNLTQGGAVPLGSLTGHNKPPHDALLIDADLVDAYHHDQSLLQASNPTFVSPRVEVLNLEDTGANDWLALICNENLTSNRTLNIIVGNAERTITFSGNPTLGDWFDQAVKQASSPTFVKVITGEVDNVAVLNLKSNVNVAIQTTPSGAPTPTLFNNSIAFELDEIGHKLVCRVKYSDGTLKTAIIALT